MCEVLSGYALLTLAHDVKDQSLILIGNWQNLPCKVRIKAEPSTNVYGLLENTYYSSLPLDVCDLKTAPLQRLLFLRRAKPVHTINSALP